MENSKNNGYLCNCLLPWQQSTLYSYERKWNPRCVANLHCECQELKHGAFLYNEAEVFNLSITSPNGRSMLPFDWLIHSSLILASCHRILFLCRFSAVEKQI